MPIKKDGGAQKLLREKAVGPGSSFYRLAIKDGIKAFLLKSLDIEHIVNCNYILLTKLP